MKNFIKKKISKITQTCYACSSQWEGLTEEGDDIYIRYRYGCLRLDINNKTIVSIDYGHSLDGVIDLNSALDLLEDYLSF